MYVYCDADLSNKTITDYKIDSLRLQSRMFKLKQQQIEVLYSN